MENLQYYQYLWKENETGITLVRVYGEYDEVRIPKKIEGKTVNRLAPYCFSEHYRAEEENICKKSYRIFSQDAGEFLEEPWEENEHLLRVLSGNQVRSVIIPPDVERLGNCIFYNCRKLEQIIFETKLFEVENSAFMNCRSLRKIVFTAEAGEQTSVDKVLAQIPTTVAVYFTGREQTAGLLYPEYSEMYEEIGPAHIFGLNIEGEGFRARKEISQGRINYAGYDSVFEKAKNEESAEILSEMSLLRLRYPYQLGEKAKEQYETYVKQQSELMITKFVKQKETEWLEFLFGSSLFSERELGDAVLRASSEGWAEGVRILLSLKKKEPQEKRHSRFDDISWD